eukprot:Skav202578  [mRNA]  locus=scaffold104:218889:219152:- [translate_table: standard]
MELIACWRSMLPLRLEPPPLQYLHFSGAEDMVDSVCTGGNHMNGLELHHAVALQLALSWSIVITSTIAQRFVADEDCQAVPALQLTQ